MNAKITPLFWILLSLLTMSCKGQESQLQKTINTDPLPGAYHLSQYLPQLENQRVGLVVNHTSMIGQTHLVDSLISLGVDINVIWAPEHGFKGTAYNGEKIDDDVYNDHRIKFYRYYG